MVLITVLALIIVIYNAQGIGPNAAASYRTLETYSDKIQPIIKPSFISSAMPLVTIPSGHNGYVPMSQAYPHFPSQCQVGLMSLCQAYKPK